jgi:uncharacterized membrane protein
MAKIEDSIEVHVPVQQAYNQWTQFEQFPKFMEGIQSVQRTEPGTRVASSRSRGWARLAS